MKIECETLTTRMCLISALSLAGQHRERSHLQAARYSIYLFTHRSVAPPLWSRRYFAVSVADRASNTSRIRRAQSSIGCPADHNSAPKLICTEASQLRLAEEPIAHLSRASKSAASREDAQLKQIRSAKQEVSSVNKTSLGTQRTHRPMRAIHRIIVVTEGRER